MRFPAFCLLLLSGLGLGVPAGCRRAEEPFYMTDLAALRRLPEEDLLRMRDDILAEAAQLPDQPVEDELPAGDALATGQWRAAAGGSGAGTAQLTKLEKGSRVVCLVGFHVTRAPDLRVEYAAAAGQFRELGPLRGNTGQQCFALPANLGTGPITRLRIRSVIFQKTVAEADLTALNAEPDGSSTAPGKFSPSTDP